MTEFAAVFRDPVIELALMRIGMTATTGQIRKAKTGDSILRRIGRMTGKAGNSTMTARERIARAVVPRQIEGGGDEALGGMALAAVSAAAAFRELSIVGVAVAIGAAFMRERLGHLPAAMAASAFHTFVPSPQWESGFRVIELRRRDLAKAPGRVALGTFRAELAAMRIVMATRAGSEF